MAQITVKYDPTLDKEKFPYEELLNKTFRWYPNDSVFNRLLYYFKDTNNTVHLINRLDKETKGLVFVAKSNYAAAIIKEVKKVTNTVIAQKYLFAKANDLLQMIK